jgi:hypothetical protein
MQVFFEKRPGVSIAGSEEGIAGEEHELSN